MSNKQTRRERILDHPSYWVEAVNGHLYNALVKFMDENDMNQTALAKHLDISTGRVSQILNGVNTNFSIEKLFETTLKLGMYPVVDFEEKNVFLEKERKQRETRDVFMAFELDTFTSVEQILSVEESEGVVISLFNTTVNHTELEVNYG